MLKRGHKGKGLGKREGEIDEEKESGRKVREEREEVTGEKERGRRL